MFAEALVLASTLMIGPFYEERTDYRAFRPFWSSEETTSDVLWPVFTAHRDWWRFCYFTHYQESRSDDSYQFEVMPIWFNGRTRTDEDYWGFFPFWGHHPHWLLMYDFDFCLWPVWMRYRMPRPSAGTWLTSNVVLFPFVHWRSDGAWGFWPFYGMNYQRESEHRYALWPIVTWANYREDRDTAGAGHSWMVFPFWASVDRARERQTMIFPPLFAYAQLSNETWRLRCPWPVVELERGPERKRTSVFPLYESVALNRFYDGAETGGYTRFGWRLVELYWDDENQLNESRVFPLWKSNDRHTRIWPFWETYRWEQMSWSGTLALFPITWVDAVDRNWSAYWTFYESLTNPIYTEHSLLWGLIRWRTFDHD